MTISEIVQRSDTTPGRIFDSTAIVLILVSVITVSVNTVPSLSPSVQAALSWSEVVIVGLFTIEYGLRIGTAPSKLRYALSFHGIVDLVAILPFYLTLGGVDLRALRILQLFRIVRILKLSRYSEAMARFGKAMALARISHQVAKRGRGDVRTSACCASLLRIRKANASQGAQAYP